MLSFKYIASSSELRSSAVSLDVVEPQKCARIVRFGFNNRDWEKVEFAYLSHGGQRAKVCFVVGTQEPYNDEDYRTLVLKFPNLAINEMFCTIFANHFSDRPLPVSLIRPASAEAQEIGAALCRVRDSGESESVFKSSFFSSDLRLLKRPFLVFDLNPGYSLADCHNVRSALIQARKAILSPDFLRGVSRGVILDFAIGNGDRYSLVEEKNPGNLMISSPGCVTFIDQASSLALLNFPCHRQKFTRLMTALSAHTFPLGSQWQCEPLLEVLCNIGGLIPSKLYTDFLPTHKNRFASGENFHLLQAVIEGLVQGLSILAEIRLEDIVTHLPRIDLSAEGVNCDAIQTYIEQAKTFNPQACDFSKVDYLKLNEYLLKYLY